MEKKIGPFLLSGLMIGPILGSGIIILPPLACKTAGPLAFYAWCLTSVLGIIFARVFAKMSLLLPGDAGVSAAVEQAFGKRAKTLTGYYLIGAVLFGPVAVMLTASSYLTVFDNETVPAAILVICSIFFLLKDTAFLSRLSLIFSSLAAFTLLAGGISTLIFKFDATAFAVHELSFETFASTMLLLFWTLVGWEVVGNYSGQVKNPDKTIPRAVNLSLLIIGAVSLSVAAATQLVKAENNITPVITPVFGPFSTLFMGILTLSLCITTYIMFVGGVARLMCSFATTRDLPRVFAQKNSSGAPVVSVLFLSGFYLLVLVATGLGMLNTAKIVLLADGFFLANVLMGLTAAFVLFTGLAIRTAIVVLIATFSLILLQSSPVILAVLTYLFCWVYRHSIIGKIMERSYNH